MGQLHLGNRAQRDEARTESPLMVLSPVVRG